MRALQWTTALALLLSVGVAGAQQPEQQAPGGVPPAEAQKAKELYGAEKVDADEVKGGEGNPTPDQIVGPPEAGPVPLQGDGHDIPGAGPQTVPAKFSAENDKKDQYSIMGYPMQLSDEQRQAILAAIGDATPTANPENQTIHAEPGVFLPSMVEAEELPDELAGEIAELRGLKYVKTDDRILLVQPSNNIVRGVIE